MKLAVQHVDGMRFLATEGGHKVVVDAAPEHGGGGSAMSAPQLFVAALGACILEFVMNSCRLRSVLVKRLSVEMECEEVPGPRRVGALAAVISLGPEPPDDVKHRVIGVARHATLANTLLQPPEVDIHFAKQGEEGSDGACS